MGAGLIEFAAEWLLAITLGAALGDREPAGWLAPGSPFGGAASVVIDASGDGDVDDAEGYPMEGEPQLDVVFADSHGFRAHLERFYELHEAMDLVKAAFSEHVRDALAAVTDAPPRSCRPTDLAAPTFRAHRAGRRFEHLGKELELQRDVIVRHETYGEHAGLTPDERWRVSRVSGLYDELVSAYREMRIAFDEQLMPEATRRGCSRQALIDAGRQAVESKRLSREATTTGPGEQSAHRIPLPPHAEPPEAIEASPVTFLVDNRRCGQALRVFIAGEQIGTVDAHSRAAFQTLAGRHSMCLLPDGVTAHCGDAGTVRTAYIHDGWEATLRCEGDERT